MVVDVQLFVVGLSSQRFGDWVALRRISSKVERVVLNALAK